MTVEEFKEIEIKFSKMLVDGIKGFIKFAEIMRKPGVVFTEEQKKKIADFVDFNNEHKRV